ncbi:MAG: DUF4870 domain-containing protein [Bradymonadales bacterium]|nr:MAG: DUF4870 domain-containing protein [Bradymonadales bacterium]
MENQEQELPPLTETNHSLIVHLLQFIGFVLPFGGIIGPLVYMLIQRDKAPVVVEAGREVLAFQVSVTLYFLALIVIGLIPIVGWILSLLLIPLGLVLVLYVLIQIIMGCVKASRREAVNYPLKLGFVVEAVKQI